MRVQLAWTMLTELVVMISSILLLKLAASLLGPVGFGEYALTRRAIALLYLPLVMGLGIAAPRYIAIARAKGIDGYTESGFATATLTAGLIPVAAVILLMNVVPEWSSRALFGTASLRGLVVPATIALAGVALHSMVYAVYRGRTEMMFANTLQLANLGVVPVASFLLASPTAAAVLTATGLGWISLSTVALMHVLYRERATWNGGNSLWTHIRLLLRFGLPRVPGEFAVVGLFAIPALIAVRSQGIVTAGQFSAAISVLTMASGAFAPVGLVVLPRASALVATGDIDALRRLVLKILSAGVVLSAVGLLVGELLIPAFIEWYFGPAFAPAVGYFRICLLGVVPYAIYVLMRSVLDALEVKAVNSRNLIVSLVVLVLLCLFNSQIPWMAGSLVGCLWLLGVLTLKDTYLRLRPSSHISPATVPA